MPHSTPIVVGIDVACLDQCAHAVALQDGRFHALKSSVDPLDAIQWCREVGASVVAINGYPRFGRTEDTLRTADQQLFDAGLSRMSAGDLATGGGGGRADAVTHVLSAGLSPFYPWYQGEKKPGTCMIETRAFAVVVALAGKKNAELPQRSEWAAVMRTVGFNLKKFGCTEDAAITAFAAQCFVSGQVERYGDKATGFVFIPDREKIEPWGGGPRIAPLQVPCSRCYGELWLCEDHPHRPFLHCRECGGLGSIGIRCRCNPGGGLPYAPEPFSQN